MITNFTSDLTATIENARAAIVTVTAVIGENQSGSSGVVWSRDGDTVYIVTCDLAAFRDGDIFVRFDSSSAVSAEIAGIDTETGIAVLKAEPGFETAPVRLGDSSRLEQGEYIIAAGGRRQQTGSGMVSFGIVSEPGHRRLSAASAWAATVLETDASVSSENSGGAMLDLGGRLVGILMARIHGGQDRMGYAIAVNEVKLIVQELIETGTVTRGSTGIGGRDVSSLLPYERNSRDLPLDLMEGVLVTDAAFSSDEEISLQEGDVIRSLDGTAVKDTEALIAMLYEHAPGDTVSFSFLRGGETLTAEMILR